MPLTKYNMILRIKVFIAIIFISIPLFSLGQNTPSENAKKMDTLPVKMLEKLTKRERNLFIEKYKKLLPEEK